MYIQGEQWYDNCAENEVFYNVIYNTRDCEFPMESFDVSENEQ